MWPQKLPSIYPSRQASLFSVKSSNTKFHNFYHKCGLLLLMYNKSDVRDKLLKACYSDYNFLPKQIVKKVEVHSITQ